ncbi:MAG: hypothetical protein MOB07_28650 [Acidobacteria bacterium]|nr:hypothetical protein [Acidobacteriota bacterium]
MTAPSSSAVNRAAFSIMIATPAANRGAPKKYPQEGTSGNPRWRLRKNSRYKIQIDEMLGLERHHWYG